MAKGRPPSGRPLRRERDERSKAASYMKISAPDHPLGPELGEPPDGSAWHPQTIEWWAMWRRSAMATIFQPVDWCYLRDTALVHTAFWDGDHKFASELRLREEKMGATAPDRERMRIRIVAPEDRTDP